MLAVAVFGLVMAHAFERGIEKGLEGANVAPEVVQEIRGQALKLAAIEIPRGVEGAQREAVKQVIETSFIEGFRLVMALGVALSLLSAICAYFFLSSRMSQLRR